MKNPPLDNQPFGDRRSSPTPSLPIGHPKPTRSGAESEAEPEFIFIDGSMVAFSTAAVHISKIAAGNGANVFEGLCLYSNIRGQSLFRLEDHVANLRKSAWRMDI